MYARQLNRRPCSRPSPSPHTLSRRSFPSTLEHPRRPLHSLRLHVPEYPACPHSTPCLPQARRYSAPPSQTQAAQSPAPGQDTKKAKASKSDFMRLFALLRPEIKAVSIAIAALLVSSAVTMAVPASMGKLIDFAVTQASSVELTRLCAALTGLFAVGGLANYLRVYFLQSTGEKLVADIRKRLFGHVMSQEMAFFDTNRTGELLNRLSSDAFVMSRALTDNVSHGLRYLTQGLAGMGMMLWLSPKLTLITLAIIPPLALAGIAYGRIVKRLSRQVQDALGKASEVAEERLSQVRTVRSFDREVAETRRYAGHVQEVFELARKSVTASATFFGFAGFGGNMMMLSILWYGGSLVTSGAMTVGGLTSFLLYATYVGFSMMGMSTFYADMMKSVGASARVFELLERKPEVKPDKGVKVDNLQGAITFKNVTFSYPSRKEAVIFNDFSLDINPGEVMAIVGPSGSGKSTITLLLVRFYDPEQGSIQIDGRDVSDYDVHWLRENVGIVQQEPVLFADTIAENIRYAKPDATMEEVMDAARKANAHSFISSFPQGYDTMVGERGTTLSGGQKQRIAIARSILKNPKILILDEATSALDTESERLVQEALERLMENKTVLMITHRLSTIKNADVITVLDQGRVVEKGTHSELMNIEDGVFKELVKSHLMGYN